MTIVDRLRWVALLALLLWRPVVLGASETGAPVLPEAQWTLAFYLAGENSLEQEQARNLREIIAAAAVKQAHIVVFMDRDEFFKPDNPITSWKGTRVFHLTQPFKAALKTPLETTLPAAIGAERFEQLILARLEEPEARRRVATAYRKKGGRYLLGPVDSHQRKALLDLLTDKADYLLPLKGREPINLVAADERTQRQFFSFLGDNFPARHYALFMVGHGSGWYGQDPTPGPGVAPKPSPEYYQILKSQVLAAAARWQPFDLIVMDSCLMADIESLWALRNAADYLVLNQIETPSWGLNYTLLLKRLEAQTAWEPVEMAKAVVSAYAQSFAKAPYPIATAAFDAGRIEPLAREWNRWFGPADQRVPALAALQVPPVPTNTPLRGAMVDMRALCDAMDLDTLDAAIAGPRGAIVASFQQKTAQRGLSIYLPQDKDVFSGTFDAYRETAWARDFPEGWVRTVATLFGAKAQKTGGVD